jgi:hypothetical protein
VRAHISMSTISAPRPRATSRFTLPASVIGLSYPKVINNDECCAESSICIVRWSRASVFTARVSLVENP